MASPSPGLKWVKNGLQTKPICAQNLVRCTPNSWRVLLSSVRSLTSSDRRTKGPTHGAISLVHEQAAGHSLCTLGSLIRRRVSRDSGEIPALHGCCPLLRAAGRLNCEPYPAREQWLQVEPRRRPVPGHAACRGAACHPCRDPGALPWRYPRAGVHAERRSQRRGDVGEVPRCIWLNAAPGGQASILWASVDINARDGVRNGQPAYTGGPSGTAAECGRGLLRRATHPRSYFTYHGAGVRWRHSRRAE
jgi:hypothetical protein